MREMGAPMSNHPPGLTLAESEQSRMEGAFREAGLQAAFRQADPEAWTSVMARIAYMPVAYSAAMIDYQLTYFQGAGRDVCDASVILYFDNRPCAIWPLSLMRVESWRIGSNCGAVLPPLFVRDFAVKSVKSMNAACIDFLDGFARAHQAEEWGSVEPFADCLGLSDWHDRIMQRGGRVAIKHDLFVDLTLDLAAIKSGFRKSYKALISSGQKLWRVFVLDGQGADVWEEFRTLHREVAGRVTRSAESWERQYEAILAGAAFLVYLRDDSRRMVGGGLFHVTRDEGLYAVAAYDRSLFDKPLGHVVQFRAIEEMRRRGLRWYKIGARPYVSESPAPTAKELNIADFKQGFATHIFPMFELRNSASSQNGRVTMNCVLPAP